MKLKLIEEMVLYIIYIFIEENAIIDEVIHIFK